MFFTLLVAIGLAFYLHRQIKDLRQRLERAENEIVVLQARRPGEAGAALHERRAPAPEQPAPGQVPPATAATPPATDRPASTPTEDAKAPAGAVPPVKPAAPASWSSSPPGATGTGTSGPSLEEAIGTKWAVYAGGVALAFGVVFLVNYTIEQGLLGAGARILLGLLLSAVLIGGGEWFRRTDKRLGFNHAAEAHIPSILTAAGTVAAFATIYAAHALYGFIGSAVAFVALGAVGIATMLAAALHGPALAGLGLAGSFVTPALISSAEPNPWPVVVYLAVVSTAALLLARVRTWAWLAGTTVAGAVAWGFALLEEATRPLRFPVEVPPVIDPVTGVATYTPPAAPVLTGGWIEATYLHAGLQLTLAAVLIALAPHFARGRVAEPTRPVRPDWIAAACLAGHALLALAILTSAPVTGAAWPIYAVVTLALLAATSYLARPVAAAAPLAGALAAATLLFWPAVREIELIAPFNALGDLLGYPDEVATFLLFAGLATMPSAAVAVWTLWRGRPLDTVTASFFALAATAAPLLVLVIAYVRAGELAASLSFMTVAFLLAGAYAFLAEMFRAIEKRQVRDGREARAAAGSSPGDDLAELHEQDADASGLASGAFAAAAVGALVIGITVITDRQYLAAALALTALATAWIANASAMPILRHVVAAIGVLIALRLLLDPVLFGLSTGSTPLLNALLVVYGVPAAAFSAAAYLLRQSHTEAGTTPGLAVHISEGVAMLLAALLAFFEIRHLTNGGNVFSASSGHVEQGLLAMTALGFSQLAARLKRDLSSIVFEVAAYAFSILALAFAVLGLGFAQNPYFTGERIAGPAVFDSLLLGYVAPGLMALYLARISRGIRHDLFVQIAGGVGLGLVFLYTTLEVRHIFQGEFITASRRTGSAEIWGYTVAWLLLGIVLLGYGLLRHLTMPRIASAVLIVAASLKVVLIDLAGVSGIWRALSFLCLGAVLIGIGLVYQRLIFAKPRVPNATPDTPPSAPES